MRTKSNKKVHRYPLNWATVHIMVRPAQKKRLDLIKQETGKTPANVIDEALPLWEEKYGKAAA